VLDRRVKELEGELFDARQRASDLKVRADYIRARNKVLVGLVEGLTSKPEGGTTDERGNPMASAKRALEALDHDMEVIGVTLRQSRKDVTELRGERASLQTNLDDAVRRIEEARERERQAEARIETFRSMLMRLRAMIESNELELQVVRNQMVMKLPEAVLFDTAEADLKPRGRDVLAGLAEVLKGVQGRDFQVAGHTDDVPISTPRYKTNWHLAAARAINVTRFLVKHGLERERLSAVAYADTRPVADERTEAARRKNRRIEIAVMPRLEELPDLSALDEVSREGPPVATDAEVAPGESAAPAIQAPVAAEGAAPVPAEAATQSAEPAVVPAEPALAPPPAAPPSTAPAPPAVAPPPPTAPTPPSKSPEPAPVVPRELPPGYTDPR
jgi:chemotaxis protein MotB